MAVKVQEAPKYPANDYTGEPLQIPTGGGNSGGMDPWQASVETRLGQLHGDIGGLGRKVDSHFLFLISAFAAGFLALLLAGATVYVRLDGKIDATTTALSAKVDGLSAKIDNLATAVGHPAQR